MKTSTYALAALIGILTGIVVAMPAFAQVGKPAIHVSAGSFHPLSDFFPWPRTRLQTAAIVGAGASVNVHRHLVARAIVERNSIALRDEHYTDCFETGGCEDDHMLTAELQLVAITNLGSRVTPYAGIGLGLRRIVMQTQIVADDIIIGPSPSAQTQTQPAASAIAGMRVSLASRIAAAAEVNWLLAGFRFASVEPIDWQTELRPTIRLEVMPW